MSVWSNRCVWLGSLSRFRPLSSLTSPLRTALPTIAELREPADLLLRRVPFPRPRFIPTHPHTHKRPPSHPLSAAIHPSMTAKPPSPRTIHLAHHFHDLIDDVLDRIVPRAAPTLVREHLVEHLTHRLRRRLRFLAPTP